MSAPRGGCNYNEPLTRQFCRVAGRPSRIFTHGGAYVVSRSVRTDPLTASPPTRSRLYMTLPNREVRAASCADRARGTPRSRLYARSSHPRAVHARAGARTRRRRPRGAQGDRRESARVWYGRSRVVRALSCATTRQRARITLDSITRQVWRGGKCPADTASGEQRSPVHVRGETA